MKIRTEHLNEQEIARHAENLKFNRAGMSGDDILEHLETCSDCQSNVMEVYELIKTDDKIVSDEFQNRAEQNTLPKHSAFSIKYIAAASIAVVLTGFFIVYHFKTKNQNPNQNQQLTEISDTSNHTEEHPEDNKVIIAQTNPDMNKSESESEAEFSDDSYQTYAVYEGLINHPLRSNNAIRILSPANDETVNQTQKIRFAWEGLESVSCTVAIMDNKGNELIKMENITGETLLTNTLNPGLYYWKIVDQKKHNLLYIGKFIVN